jgi:molybdenum cofactor cytidylyltransferase
MATTDGAPRVAGVVLAAGGSRRMGAPKQLLRLGSRVLLQHVVDAALASSLDEVVLVLGHRADEVRAALTIPPGARVNTVVNSDWERGQSTSLRCGLEALGPAVSAIAVLLGDQPGLGASDIDRVVGAFLASGAAAARSVYPEAGAAPGHPVLLARRIWPEVAALAGDTGARALFAAHPDWLLEVPLPGKPPADIDTPMDHRRAVGAVPPSA